MSSVQMGTSHIDLFKDQIFNVMTEKRNAVQLRTGLFEACIELPTIVGNLGLGPELDTSLFYSPMVNNLSALGDGWSFAMTTYEEKTELLTLRTGETMVLKRGGDLENPAVTARWESGGSILTVERKDGRTETLKKQGGSTLWMPVRITADGYRYIALSWDTVEQGPAEFQVRLIGVQNDTPSADSDPPAAREAAGKKLLSITYEPRQEPYIVKMTFWPNSDETGVYEFVIGDVALQEAVSPAGELSIFEYVHHDFCGLLLSRIVTFDGLEETVAYVKETRTFPSDPALQMLPCVARHTIKPRKGGSDVVTSYTYSDNSGVPIGGYTTTVKQVSAAGANTTTYIYDSTHNLFKEIIECGSATRERRFINKRLGRSVLGSLSSNVSHNVFKRGKASRTETSLTFMVDSVLRAIESKDVVSAFEFAGEGVFKDAYMTSEKSFSLDLLDRLPFPTSEYAPDYMMTDDGDPLQATSSPFSEIVYPEDLDRIVKWPPSYEVTSRDVTYTSISGLNRKKPTYTRTTFGDVAVGQETTYFTTGCTKGLAKTVRQGRESSERVLPDSAALTEYTYAFEGTAMTVTTTERRGKESRYSSRTVSTLSGRCVQEVDMAGNITAYGYDASGRLTSSTTCKGTTYEEISRYAYPSTGRMEVTDPDGRRHAIVSDGRGEVVEAYIHDGTQWVQTLGVDFDDKGRKSRSRTLDIANGQVITESCDFGYDDWGQECSRKYGDGRQEFDCFDPLFLVREEWEGSADAKHRKRTFHRLDGRASCIRWLDASGAAYRGQALSYSNEGLSRVVTAGADGTEAIFYDHDALGRVVQAFRAELDSRTFSALPFVISGEGNIASPKDDPELGKSITYDLRKTVEHATRYTYRDEDYLDAQPIRIELFDARQASRTWGLWGIGWTSPKYPQHLPIAGDPHFKFMTEIGSRQFDAWGRTTSFTRADIVETMTYQGASPAPSMLTRADGSKLTYEYIKELGYRPLKVAVSGAGLQGEKTFTYTHGGERKSTASDASSKLVFEHDLGERVISSSATLSTRSACELRQTWSEGGRLLTEVDAAGGKTIFGYDSLGRRVKTERGSESTVRHVYGKSGLLASEAVICGDDMAEVSYVYDAMAREASRVFSLPNGRRLTMERLYDAMGRIASVSIKEGTTVLGSKTCQYDMRDRVVSCATTGICQPRNPKGKAIDSQTFVYDALSNVTKCTTTFGSATCISTYEYAAGSCRLTTVTHDHDDYKVGGKLTTTLTYDACGRLTRDAYGKTYEYDWLGRLARAGSRYYAYDAMDRLATCGTATDMRQLVYDGMDVHGEHGAGGTGRYFHRGSAACSIQRVKLSGVDRTLFGLYDMDGTLLVTYDQTAKTLKHHAYTAYGQHSSDEVGSMLGFQGAYRDTESASGDVPPIDRYPLGQGYRWYGPACMQFNAPDSESPFGIGGIHPYGYCDGDPVNAEDPSGHGFWDFGWTESFVRSPIVGMATPYNRAMSALNSLPEKTSAIVSSVVLGIVGVVGAMFTGGTSLILLGIALSLAVVSAATGIAAAVLSDSNPEVASVLGWISLGTGLASGVASIGAGMKLGAASARRGAQWMLNVAKSMRPSVRAAAAKVARGRAIVDELLGAIPRGSANAVVDEALGALPGANGTLLPRTFPAVQSKPFVTRFVEKLKPHAVDLSTLIIDGSVGTLGHAGVFEDEANAAAFTSEFGTTVMTAMDRGFSLKTSLGGRWLAGFSRAVRFR